MGRKGADNMETALQGEQAGQRAGTHGTEKKGAPAGGQAGAAGALSIGLGDCDAYLCYRWVVLDITAAAWQMQELLDECPARAEGFTIECTPTIQYMHVPRMYNLCRWHLLDCSKADSCTPTWLVHALILPWLMQARISAMVSCWRCDAYNSTLSILRTILFSA